MQEDSRAYVAWTAGRLMGGWKGFSIFDPEQERRYTLSRREKQQPLEHFSRRENCSARRDPQGTNFCLVRTDDGQHICFTTYERQFEGFDHGTSSHFSGFVDETTIFLYDYGASKYFIFYP